MDTVRPRIAFISTGGTIASLGADPFDLLDYNASDVRVGAAEIIKRTGLQATVADIVAVDFRSIDSTAIMPEDWGDLAALCRTLAADAAVQGIVIGHGTASLEETAWALALVLDERVPVVLTGSMRPLNGLSSDASANLAAAIRVASTAPTGRVLVVLNDEIHDPRRLTKAHTLRLDAFRSSDYGPVGTVGGLEVRLEACGGGAARVRFAPDLLRRLPRVDVVYSHVGADGTAIRAFVEAGARGIVAAGFGPGLGTPAQTDALAEAVSRGVTVVQSSRTGAGPVVDSAAHRRIGIVAGNDLNPQKARVLLGLCLARGDDRRAIEAVFKGV